MAKGRIADFVYADANPAACEYDGLDRGDLVGSLLLSLYPDFVGIGVLEQFSEVVETGQPLALDDVVYPVDNVSGQYRHLDIRGARVADGLSFTWRDVTERQTAARKLAESEERFRLLAENASDVVMRLSPDRRFEWVSESAGEILGWQGLGLVDRWVDDFIHPEDLAQFQQMVTDSGPVNVASAEFRFRRPDGSYQWVECRIRAKVDKQGARVAVVGGLFGISERREAEARDRDRLADLVQFQRLTVGRELKMIELKKEIEHLRRFGPGGQGEAGDLPVP